MLRVSLRAAASDAVHLVHLRACTVPGQEAAFGGRSLKLRFGTFLKLFVRNASCRRTHFQDDLIGDASGGIPGRVSASSTDAPRSRLQDDFIGDASGGVPGRVSASSMDAPRSRLQDDFIGDASGARQRVFYGRAAN